MEEQDRVSQASSVVTVSSFPVKKGGRDKLQTFGKRWRSAKRDPNCAVVIRGWLNKKDSSGLKLWKRRWFVLSDYCLFYYKDSREESVLGSIPLPSYHILFCSPRECKNRKYTFKVVHQGMRSYFFSADTQEDMLGWVRALSQSAAMEPDSISRRCSSYQDFTQIGSSSESVVLPRSPSVEDGLSQRHRHVSRTLSEPSHLTGGRAGVEQRSRRILHRSPSPSTPSPPEFDRRRGCGPHLEEDYHHYTSGRNTPSKHIEFTAAGSLTPRGQLGSRPHTPVGRVDIRPQDDPVMMPQTLCYGPASPKLEFKATPGMERWQNISKPVPTYGSVHHMAGGRRPLGKSYSTGANTDLLPPLPPSTRAPHAPHPPHHHHHHHHHHRSHLSVCVLPAALPPKPDPRDTPPIRPLESDADAVLTRLCGCDKLLQALSVELAQLQVDKDSIQCALEMTRLQLEDSQNQTARAQEAVLTQKALLQEELVTIRARMCDVSLEMERVWSQYERMESELSVIRSQLQHICNFGMPQEQSQAQRELWMMEDILAGLKVNRDHFHLLLSLQRHQIPPSHLSGSPTEGQQSGLPMGVEQDPPARPPLPQDLLETDQSRDQGHGWMDLTYEGVYSDAVDPLHRRVNSQPELLKERKRRDTSESRSSSRWTTPDTTIQSTKKAKMSEGEQMERMKRNQDRLAHRKKPPMPSAAGAQYETSEFRKEQAPFPLRVTRVVTAVLPSSIVARRVSVEDPPPELAMPLPEQIPPEMQRRLIADQNKPILSKSPRWPLAEAHDQNRFLDQPAKRLNKAQRDLVSEGHGSNVYDPSKRRQQHQNTPRTTREDPWLELSQTGQRENPRARVYDPAGLEDGREPSDLRAEGRTAVAMTSDPDPDLCLTLEQREAKLRRVERIRQRVIKSAVRESAMAPGHLSVTKEGQEYHRVPPTPTSDTSEKCRPTSDSEIQNSYGGCHDDCISSPPHCVPAELKTSGGISQDEDEEDEEGEEEEQGGERKNRPKSHLESKTQHKDYGVVKGVFKRRIKSPSSSSHTTTMTVSQKDGVEGFHVSHEGGREEELDELMNKCGESSESSANLRTKWFLSTNQWQGLMPLQSHGTEPLLCDDRTPDIYNQPEVHGLGTDDSNDISSAVSQSLEKMKENHSLFYKIACDITISDTDITKNDGNASVQMLSGAGEGMASLNADSTADEGMCHVVKSSDEPIRQSSPSMSPESVSALSQNIVDDLSTGSSPNDPSVARQDTQTTVTDTGSPNTSVKAATELCTNEEIPDEGTDKDEPGCKALLKIEETTHGGSEEGTRSDQDPERIVHTIEEYRETKEPGEQKVDRGESEALKMASSLCCQNERAVQDGGKINSVTKSNSCYEGEGGRPIRSASFGKARVTVLRTSL
ncbi:pleckstrin homology domain-containing family A member 7 [Lampris incognitus]|uniref:pleckstrin homology domain-containing family A member 7 n=1 Tax=Lampris incognitus TaxID=2546036 RepID=UPI0024B56F0A|nr:pleckstrin homology domain-containing family A member 7 [Lampris incognitus]